jgi:hypothetical protein
VSAAAVTPVGAAGASASVIAVDPEPPPDPADPLPSAFTAVTVKVYATPGVRPVIVVVVGGGVPATVRPVQAEHAGLAVTMYPVIGRPLSAGAVQVSVIVPSGFSVGVGELIDPGGAVGVSVFEPVDAGLLPAALVAVTVNVYVVPSWKPVMWAAAAAGLPLTVRPVQAEHAGLGVTV